MYTSTTSEDVVLDRHGPFVICSPCSGHGAKFAPLVGEIATDLPAAALRRTRVSPSPPTWGS